MRYLTLLLASLSIKMTNLVACAHLYHATRRSSLDAIMKEGLLSRFHGKIHGAMEYGPAGDSVYLSRMKQSNNLNAALFDGEDVVVSRSLMGSSNRARSPR